MPTTHTLRIALAQINMTVGNLDANATIIRRSRREARDGGADLVMFPELALSGYPPEDLVLKPAFLDAVATIAAQLATETADGGPALLLTAPWRRDGHVYNAALLLDEGRIAAVRDKVDLPNYGVFDEKRLFRAGDMPGPVSFRGVRLGLPICEDIWSPDVVECLEESGADILLSPNGSPFEVEKADARLNHAVARVTESGLPLVYLNRVGGQDELVFDGASFILNGDCGLACRLPSFAESLYVSDWQADAGGAWHCRGGGPLAQPPERLPALYAAMVLGLRNYVHRNGFPGLVLGLSGGIDSALSAAVAVDALGPAHVRVLMLPSPYTGPDSLADAQRTAALLGLDLARLEITPAMDLFQEMLSDIDGMTDPGTARHPHSDTTAENIQARIRGLCLMAVSNKTGAMLLTTGNKSEMSVGYATLYGDMCGGFSVLKDIYKTDVFALARLRNRGREGIPGTLHGPDGPVMPERVIDKPPSAELRPDQKDVDSLPAYEILDDILSCLVERDMAAPEIAARGHAPELVARVWRMLDMAEYKRRQAPPGIKVTGRAFGRDRRYPICNGFRGP